jgi:ABC-type multidrug transport system fused ATPase/permease subunit
MVQEALGKARHGRTMVVIAHRMSTIESCDKVFMLENGCVAESGSFNELKEKGGAFSAMATKKKKE